MLFTSSTNLCFLLFICSTKKYFYAVISSTKYIFYASKYITKIYLSPSPSHHGPSLVCETTIHCRLIVVCSSRCGVRTDDVGCPGRPPHPPLSPTSSFINLIMDSKTQVRNRKRTETVSTAMFDHFAYEVIAQMAGKHSSLPEEKQNLERLQSEIEDFGFQIGRRAVDYLGMLNQDANK